MHPLKKRYQHFIAPDGRGRWDELAVFFFVLMFSMGRIFDLPSDDSGVFYPRVPFGGLLDLTLLVWLAVLGSGALAIGALWSYRHVKRIGRTLLSFATHRGK